MKQLLHGAAFLMLLTQGCTSEPSPPATATPAAVPLPAETTDHDALAAANAAADDLGRTLRGRLMQAMAHGGAEEAAEVCAQEAPALTAEVAARHHARVGRNSLRMRGNAPAPSWVQAWLEAADERSAEGVVGLAEVQGEHARVLRPIAVEGPCLTCHGEHITPEVSAILARHYPSDRATGYAVGALRGALWAEVSRTP